MFKFNKKRVIKQILKVERKILRKRLGYREVKEGWRKRTKGKVYKIQQVIIDNKNDNKILRTYLSKGR